MTGPVVPAEIDVAALHLARAYGDGDNSPTALRRWQARIRLWAHRYPDQLRQYGRIGRRTVYDLAELDTLAQRLLPPPA